MVVKGSHPDRVPGGLDTNLSSVSSGILAVLKEGAPLAATTRRAR
jgi:hypothetical protein